MKLIFDERGNLEALQHALSSLRESSSVASLMVLGCTGNDWPKEPLDRMLRNLRMPVFGGLFPSIHFRARRHERGLIVAGFSRKADLAVIDDLGDPGIDIHHSLHEQTSRWPGPTEASTLIVFVDAVAPRLGTLVQELFFAFGLDNSFVGGGAGTLPFDQAMPCVITPNGLLTGAAVCARLPLASSVAARHGWEAAGEPMVVTAGRDKVIDALDHEAALPVYERHLRQRHRPPLSPDNFPEHARHHPIGIRKTAEEFIVRDPVRIDRQGGLACIGEVPVGSTVQILHGSHDALIDAARQARAAVDEYMLNRSSSCYLVLESVSRALSLEDRLADELQAVSQNDLTFGAFTLGEIANMGRKFLEFYTKTIVVARFEEHLEP